MALQLRFARASGVLFPNPLFGQMGHAPYCGFVVFQLVGSSGGRFIRLDACAWPSSTTERHCYRFCVGGALFGAMRERSADELMDGSPELDGAFGREWEMLVDGWPYYPTPDAEPHIFFSLTTSTDEDPFGSDSDAQIW